MEARTASKRLPERKMTVELEEDNDKRWIDIPGGFSVGDEVYLLQIKAGSKRYNRVLPMPR